MSFMVGAIYLIEHIVRLDFMLAIIAVCAIGGFYAKGRWWKALLYASIGPVVLIPMWHIAVVGVSVPLRFVHNTWPAFGPKVESPDGPWWWIAAFFFNAHLLGVLVTVLLFAFYCHHERKNRDFPVGLVWRRRRPATESPPLPEGVPVSKSGERSDGPPVLVRKKSNGKKNKLRIHSPRRS